MGVVEAFVLVLAKEKFSLPTVPKTSRLNFAFQTLSWKFASYLRETGCDILSYGGPMWNFGSLD
jgi:hypothetical protein